MLVEAFVVQPTFEAFDVGVLVRLAWFDQALRDASHVSPLHHRLATELLAIVTTNDLRQAT